MSSWNVSKKRIEDCLKIVNLKDKIKKLDFDSEVKRLGLDEETVIFFNDF